MQHPVVIKPSAVIHSQGEVQLPSCLLLSPWICLAQASEHLQMGKGVVLSCALEMAYTVKQWFTNSIFIKEMCETGLHISSSRLSFPRLQLSCSTGCDCVPFSAAGPQSQATEAISWEPCCSQRRDSCMCSRRPAGPLASRFASSCQDFWWHSEETDILCAHVAAPEAART